MSLKFLARSAVLAAVLAAVVLALAVAFDRQRLEASAPSGAAADQGCVNQGSDRREFAPVICWLQQRLSWKSEHEPYFTLIGKADGTQLGLAWPPYLVFNSPQGNGNWLMFRIGFRYDRNWRGYIFPTVAAKRLSHPLRY
jgi:hypothetical protein